MAWPVPVSPRELEPTCATELGSPPWKVNVEAAEFQWALGWNKPPGPEDIAWVLHNADTRLGTVTLAANSIPEAQALVLSLATLRGDLPCRYVEIDEAVRGLVVEALQARLGTKIGGSKVKVVADGTSLVLHVTGGSAEGSGGVDEIVPGRGMLIIELEQKLRSALSEHSAPGTAPEELQLELEEEAETEQDELRAAGRQEGETVQPEVPAKTRSRLSFFGTQTSMVATGTLVGGSVAVAASAPISWVVVATAGTAIAAGAGGTYLVQRWRQRRFVPISRRRGARFRKHGPTWTSLGPPDAWIVDGLTDEERLKGAKMVAEGAQRAYRAGGGQLAVPLGELGSSPSNPVLAAAFMAALSAVADTMRGGDACEQRVVSVIEVRGRRGVAVTFAWDSLCSIL